MRCPNCGKEIANDSVFCEYCGTQINRADASHKEKSKVKWGQLLIGLFLIIGIPSFLFTNKSKDSHSSVNVSQSQLSYKIVADNARLYHFMQPTNGTPYMLASDCFYEKGCIVKGEVVYLEGQGNYLRVNWRNIDNTYITGYLMLSDVVEY